MMNSTMIVEGTSAVAPRDPELSRWEAVLARDPSRDGEFYFAVKTTGVYCRPSCASRHPRRENVLFFRKPDQAEGAGFRACLRCRPRSAANRRQAMVPRGAAVLPNPHGTAPGLYLEAGDRVVVLLPGPPRELLPMLDGPVRERLAGRTEGRRLFTRVIRVFGRTESHTEEAVRPFYAGWARQRLPIEVTILAARGAIDLHLTLSAADPPLAEEALASAAAQATTVLGDDVYSDRGEAIEVVLGTLLRERGWRLAVAESCTGGLVLKRLTDIPGSSDYVECGVVSYSNASKTTLLHVPAETIIEHGAVSEAVAGAMAAGVRRRAGVEVGVAITGIAGPGGGSADKPVGLVFLHAVGPRGDEGRRIDLPGDREMIRGRATAAALHLMRRLLEKRHTSR